MLCGVLLTASSRAIPSAKIHCLKCGRPAYWLVWIIPSQLGRGKWVELFSAGDELRMVKLFHTPRLTMPSVHSHTEISSDDSSIRCLEYLMPPPGLNVDVESKSRYNNSNSAGWKGLGCWG